MGIASHVRAHRQAKTLEPASVSLVCPVTQSHVRMTGKQRIERDRDEDSLPGWVEASGPVLDLVVALPRSDDQVANEDTDALALVSCLPPHPGGNGKRYECLKPIVTGHETGSLSGRQNLVHLAEGDDENKS